MSVPRNACFVVVVAVAAAVLVTGVTLRASEDDDRIEASFKQTYVYKTYLKDDAFKAEAKAGVVTLIGTVADETSKALAEETAANLSGVTRVDNQLATKAAAAADHADLWIGRRVTVALQFHRNVNAGRIAVEVQDGIVTLKGEAASVAQKELSAEYTRDIEGVKAVKNEMTVAPALGPAERTVYSPLDDASVTAQVRTALRTHRLTRAGNTRVTTRNGEVTLTGIARSAAEKALAAELVKDIWGVVSVKNQITVMPAADANSR